MPTYIYHCNTCGKQVELYQPYDVEQREEPECCHEAMQRVYQVVNVHYKGRGWYYTDKGATGTP